MIASLRYAAYILAGVIVLSLGYGVGTLVKCPTEDSLNCVYLAPFHGNGGGRSFVDLGGTAYYFSE